MRIYLSGQNTFENRGCEAIVRSTVARLRDACPDVTIIIPSSDIERDLVHWPEASCDNIEFVPAFLPWQARYWVRAQWLPVPSLKNMIWPFPMPTHTQEAVASADIVLAIGGDNYSLDYRLPTPTMAVDKFAMDIGKPVHLWGASVGPFDKVPSFVPVITKHLKRMQSIQVRETASQRYLTDKLGLSNVALMADPAFTLEKEDLKQEFELPADRGHGLLGLNVSPLIERYANSNQSLAPEVADFVKMAASRGYGVLLIPHVEPAEGVYNSDREYMHTHVMQTCSELGDAIKIAPAGMNAAELKMLLSRMRFFIGARTHATIGAMSSLVPTISIAYSVKAVGINNDLLQGFDVVIPTRDVSAKRLLSSLEYLEEHETAIRGELQRAVKVARERVEHASQQVLSL